MYVEYSGWTIERGFFHCDVYVDEKKNDYEIHFADGSVLKQNSSFENYTADWNNDGDVYSRFGAWFNEVNPDGSLGRGDFWSVTDMVQAVADSMDPNASVIGVKVTAIPGITIPPLEKRPTLDEHIRNSEKRAMHQEIERNQKMQSLGIRPSGEPWVR